MSKKQQIQELERRVEELEDKFKFPNIRLGDSSFESWVIVRAVRGHRWLEKEFYLLLEHLGLDIETQPEKKVVKKRKAQTKKESK